MPLILAAVLGLIGVAFTIAPLVGPRRVEEPRAPAAVTDLAERETAAKASLREVELDYQLGNLASADYQSLRARYERRALAALRSRYVREQELDALIERELEALRAEPAPAAAVARATPGAPGALGSRAPRPTPPAPRGPQARRRKGGARG